MKLLVDMNLSPRLCALLSKAGHEAKHWSEIGDPRADDAELLSWAKRLPLGKLKFPR
jgi:predicted nuclease of predicted toxin-antitoxin system